MTLDGVIEVGEWYVADGDHDRAGKDQLPKASHRIACNSSAARLSIRA